MGLNSEVKDDKTLSVNVDSIRSDILHPCDLAEDIAIAHNYN
jgi:phenylalanyl-tRNA synthetase beta chain